MPKEEVQRRRPRSNLGPYDATPGASRASNRSSNNESIEEDKPFW